jgi:hypothetical protein
MDPKQLLIDLMKSEAMRSYDQGAADAMEALLETIEVFKRPSYTKDELKSIVQLVLQAYKTCVAGTMPEEPAASPLPSSTTHVN